MGTLPGFEGFEEVGDYGGSPVQGREEDLHAERVRGVFEARADVAWMGDYWLLRDEGWDWRKAAFIAWSATPVEGRWPETQEALAREVLGLRSARSIRHWRQQNPAIDERVASLLVESLMDARSDVIAALVEVAGSAVPAAFRDRRMYLEMVGLYQPERVLRLGEVAAEDLAGLSDAELRAMAAREGEITTDREVSTTDGGGRGDPAPTDGEMGDG